MSSSSKIPVVLLGATGMVGQRTAALLRDHALFEVVALSASDRSAGKRYRDACRWHLPGERYAGHADAVLLPCDADAIAGAVPAGAVAISMLPTDAAKAVERALTERGVHVVSNASTHRMDGDVPLVVPEINADHLARAARQPTRGKLVTNPNCTSMPLVMALKPLQGAVGIEAVCMASYQAVSGAGYPGEASWDMLDNVHPHAGNEEEKLGEEPQKIMGSLDGDRFVPADFAVSARCVRVPVTDGHLIAVQVKTRQPLSPADAAALFAAWDPGLDAPLAPHPPLHVAPERDRPSPRWDAMNGGGMATTVGRIEKCPVMGLKFFALAHNTVRGAAGGALVVAETMARRGMFA
jgi:aspartate-semialdehyde dehydrogenase